MRARFTPSFYTFRAYSRVSFNRANPPVFVTELNEVYTRYRGGDLTTTGICRLLSITLKGTRADLRMMRVVANAELDLEMRSLPMQLTFSLRVTPTSDITSRLIGFTILCIIYGLAQTFAIAHGFLPPSRHPVEVVANAANYTIRHCRVQL